MPQIDEFLNAMHAAGGSDLHLMEGQPPKTRVHGHITTVEGCGNAILTNEFISACLEEIAPERKWDSFMATGDADFAYAMAPAEPGGHADRFRCNYYRHAHGLGAVLRVIPSRILTMEDLNLPPVLSTFCDLASGLVLVTGPTGSGKSTTLAAMIDRMNSTQNRHILTIEEPIEFVHPNRQSVITQREVGEDTESFAAALRSAPREDCNVVLVGEMRDLETISLALSAAEMGVLVFGTLHTNSAAKTVDRIIDVFPPAQQPQARSILAGSLRGVCSQILLRTADGRGRTAVNEILIQNMAASAAIREGKIAKVRQVIQANRKLGMITMDDALIQKVRDKKITAEAAYAKALDKEAFCKELKYDPSAGQS